MSIWRAAWRKRIKNNATVQGLVGAKIDFGKRLDKDQLPGVHLQVRSDPRPKTMNDYQGLRQSRVQVDVYSSRSSKEASDIAEAIIDAVSLPWRDEALGVRFDAPGIEGPEDSGSQENDVYVYRARLEFLVWHARI